MRISTNVWWSFFGTCLPLLGGFIAVPHLIEILGAEKFGILSIAWIVVGYFSFFDLGLSRAMTQAIAQKMGSGNFSELSPIFHSGMILMSILGVLGGLLVAALAPWLVESKLAISSDLKQESLTSFCLLAGSIPIVIISAGLRGVFEGLQRFDIVNIIRAPLGLLNYFGPLIILPYSNSMSAVVGSLVIGRIVLCMVYSIILLRLYPHLFQKLSSDRNHLHQLISVGSWMTISNITGPLLLYLGRFALAFLGSVEAVSYFSTPYDVVINLLIIPSVFVAVLFPTFSQMFAEHSKVVASLYKKWMGYNFIAMFILCLLGYLIAKPALTLWLGVSFAKNCYIIAKWLLVGMFINSFGHLSQSLVQAYGRPDLTAKLHVGELIVYIPYMWWFISKFGAEGAAISWVIRVIISTIILSLMAQGCLSGFIKRKRK